MPLLANYGTVAKDLFYTRFLFQLPNVPVFWPHCMPNLTACWLWMDIPQAAVDINDNPLSDLYIFGASNIEYPCQYRFFGAATQLRQYLPATTLIWCSRKSIWLLLSPIFTALLTVIQVLAKEYLAILHHLSLHSYRMIVLQGRIAHSFNRLMCWCVVIYTSSPHFVLHDGPFCIPEGMAMPSRDHILWLIRGHLLNQILIKSFPCWAKPLCKSHLSLMALGTCWLVIYALPLTWALSQHASSLPTHILSPNVTSPLAIYHSLTSW